MSWKIEVADTSGPVGNALRFATEDEAKRYGLDLFSRWMALKERPTVSESPDPVNYQWIAGKLMALPKVEA